MNQVFALVDCNNFYASCEKLFRPDLRETPVVVLSNNDGCVVARSKEAKAMGIKMGVPIHLIKTEIQRHRIKIFSSNYTLYGDMSRRVMTNLEALAPKVDVYSIDEAFLDLTGINQVMSFEAFGRQVKDAVYQNVGLPVCVGIAPTRTLAKLANYAAKKYSATGGVVDLTDQARQRRLIARVPVGEVWGVGTRLSAKLQAMGITTALQLADADLTTLRKRFSVVLERTARELNGVCCLVWEDVPAPKKQIMCSRSFGQPIQTLWDLEAAVAQHATRATEKLRHGQQYASELMVFIRTNPFKPHVPQYSRNASIRLVTPTQDSRVIVQKALTQLRSIYRSGYDYAKAGVMLGELMGGAGFQEDLFASASSSTLDNGKSARLMAVIDEINVRSRATIVMARSTGPAAHTMRRQHLSPAYTTDWNSLPSVN
ncbi:translesion error-prone DNA polymerase V subunit UmuC [Marinobacter sp. M-5]|uniref:translesion error-prone DNA polymerase V subunit UmuC n=1 Tax=Marinobacter sp. M-5 TaxID=3081089 RepID=UPI00293C891E|nr:translesion error-prone DNA polymerase V subunit UmuC [Marinobacter sp. M-5]MDV3504184.1 translesion error-prone DNA polymerase V subunit UmuC [Marinobacter sp. M-5]